MTENESSPAVKSYFAPMHTAEHLLNGAIARRLGCGRAFETHIERKKSKCDFHFERNLTTEELQQIEQEVNGQIEAQVPVSDEVLRVDAAAKLYDLSRVPAGASTVRIVHIGEFDSCACIGEHVANTREVPLLRIVSSDWNDGVLRVRFKFCK